MSQRELCKWGLRAPRPRGSGGTFGGAATPPQTEPKQQKQTDPKHKISDSSQGWAMTQNNLASALSELAGLSIDERRREYLEEAANIFAKLIAASEERKLDRSSAADFLGNFSFFRIKLEDPSGALAAAKKGLEADPSQIWIKTNLLTAYLLLDEREKAEAVLTENARVMLSGKPFWEVMLDDFKDLQKFGVSHSNLERMRRYIETHYKSETE